MCGRPSIVSRLLLVASLGLAVSVNVALLAGPEAPEDYCCESGLSSDCPTCQASTGDCFDCCDDCDAPDLEACRLRCSKARFDTGVSPGLGYKGTGR